MSPPTAPGPRLFIWADRGTQALVGQPLGLAGLQARELGPAPDPLEAAWGLAIDLLLLAAEPVHAEAAEHCRRLRRYFQFPILALERGGGEPERVALLDAGADDVLALPSGLAELPARCTMLLRRIGRQLARDPDSRYLRAAALRLDIARCRLLLAGGAGVDLSPAQTRLLGLLLSAGGACVPLPAVSAHLFGAQPANAARRIANLVRDLEARLAPAGHPPCVAYVKGHGYRVVAPEL